MSLRINKRIEPFHTEVFVLDCFQILSFFEEYGHRKLSDLATEFEAVILPPRSISLDEWKDFEPIVRYEFV